MLQSGEIWGWGLSGRWHGLVAVSMGAFLHSSGTAPVMGDCTGTYPTTTNHSKHRMQEPPAVLYPPLYKLRHCPSYSGCRGRIDLGPTLIRYQM